MVFANATQVTGIGFMAKSLGPIFMVSLVRACCLCTLYQKRLDKLPDAWPVKSSFFAIKDKGQCLSVEMRRVLTCSGL